MLIFPVAFLAVCWYVLTSSVIRKSTSVVQYVPASSIADSLEVAAEGLSKFQAYKKEVKESWANRHAKSKRRVHPMNGNDASGEGGGEARGGGVTRKASIKAQESMAHGAETAGAAWAIYDSFNNLVIILKVCCSNFTLVSAERPPEST